MLPAGQCTYSPRATKPSGSALVPEPKPGALHVSGCLACSPGPSKSPPSPGLNFLSLQEGSEELELPLALMGIHVA